MRATREDTRLERTPAAIPAELDPADRSSVKSSVGSPHRAAHLFASAHPQLSIVMSAHSNDGVVDMQLIALREACAGIAVEIIVAIDGCIDDTTDRLTLLAHQLATPTCTIHVMHRPPRDEHSDSPPTVVQMGIDHARARYVAVIHQEMHHPYQYRQLMRLYDAAIIHDADVVMATSGRTTGGEGDLPRQSLAHPRRWLAWAARLVFPEHLLRVTSPLGELFLFRRETVAGLKWRSARSELALDLLIRSPWVTLVEVPSIGPVDRPHYSVPNRPHGSAFFRQVVYLLRNVPSAGLIWKITTAWLAAGLVALLPSAYLDMHHTPRWLTWLLALEILLMGVAVTEEVNARHALNVGKAARRWIVSHVKKLVPICTHAASTFFISNVFLSWPAGLVAASTSSLVVYHLLQPERVHHRVLVTNAAGTSDETMVFGSAKSTSAPLVSAVTTAALLMGLVYVAYAQLGPVAALAALVLSTTIVMQYSIDRDKAITVVLALVTAIATIDYASWRVAMTNWPAWFIAAPLLGAEALGMVHTLGMQWTLWPRKEPRLRWTEDPTRRPIFIFIPTVAEGVSVLEPTVRAAQAARAAYLRKYHHGRVEIVICNDGRVAGAANWQETEALARRAGIHCVTRDSGGGAKAGNIEHARQKVGATGDALIVIFDADQVAHPDFLLKTIQPLCDREVGWVQTGQYYSNMDNPVARWANDQQALFYHLLCPGKAALNAAFICGTNVMIRAAALDEIGGLPQDSITEDFAASIELHPRWRSNYLSDVLATGLGPMDLGSYFKQQRRWALGTLSVLRSHWRAIFLPRKAGLRLGQRLQYALACTHYLSGVRDLVYVIAPLLFVACGVSAVRGARLETFLWHFLPYWCASMGAFVYAAWKKTGWRGVVIGFASFPVLVGAAISAFTGRHAAFAVTSKRRASRVSLAPVVPHVVAWAACAVALVWNWRQHNLLEGSSFFVQMWLVYITAMLSLSLWLAADDILHRYGWWSERRRVRTLGTQHRPIARPRIAATRPAMAVFICLIVLSGCVMRSADQDPQRGAPVVPASAILRQAPYLGITGDTAVVAKDLPLLQTQQHLRFGIVGRTQNVAEHFDSAWAGDLSEQGAYPWITLQFGHYLGDGSPSLDASLAAIANGLHDDEICRWAQEIHAFGKPVLITIIPNADRNWSLSSAVANGGIPADAAHAWNHVHTLFQEAGATNVSWVWAPKDPAHDDLFAPPSSLYDVVLVNMTYNPAGLTDDPGAISDVVAYHPDKPVLVELTSVHPDQNEARWLQQVSGAVAGDRAIEGLVYFDGAPGESRSRSAPPKIPPDMTLLTWLQAALATTNTASTTSSQAHDR